MTKCSLDILLVEDDADQAVLFLTALKDTGSKLEISHEATVGAAINMIRECAPDHRPRLVLLDFNLPPRHGIEVLRYLRGSRDPSVRFTPVIMLSSSIADKDVWLAYESGANCYLQKPGDLEETCKLAALLEAFWCMARLPHPVLGAA